MLNYLLALLAGFAGGFVGSIVGGGGLITIPALMFLGLPPVNAIATSRFGTIGLFGSAIHKYSKAKKIVWPIAIAVFIIYSVAAFIGSNVTLAVDQDLLSRAIGVIILAALALIVFKPEIGVKRRKPKTILAYISSFFVGLWGGFFGGGYGILARYVFTMLFGLKFLESIATSMIAGLGIVIVSVAVFLLAGVINFELGIPIGIGFLLGGYVGPRVALKKGNKWVRLFFIGYVLIAAVKFLFF